MTDQFSFDNHEPTAPEYQDRAGNFVLEQLRNAIPPELISIDEFQPNGIYKPSDGQTEVGRILISTQLNLNSLSEQTSLAQLKNILSSISTNQELSEDLLDFIERANIIRSLLLPRGKIVFYKGFTSYWRSSKEIIPLEDIAKFIKLYSETLDSTEEDIISVLSVLFNTTDGIDLVTLDNFLNGSIRYTLSIVYKRISDGDTALEREITFYRLLSKNGFHTLCAFSITPLSSDVDQYDREGAYEFTLEEKGMVTFREDANLFDESNKILLTFFQELARLHNLYIFHGDPHFENIGYKLGQDGNVIIIFDLVRSSIQKDFTLRTRSLDFDLSVLIANISKSLIDIVNRKGAEEKNNAILYVSKCYSLYLDDLDKSGRFTREELDSARRILREAIANHKLLLGID